MQLTVLADSYSIFRTNSKNIYAVYNIFSASNILRQKSSCSSLVVVVIILIIIICKFIEPRFVLVVVFCWVSGVMADVLFYAASDYLHIFLT